MTIKRTISGMIGKGSINHNERKFIAENVDARRTVQNQIVVSENIRDVYHELFDPALERYNAKQKRKDRRIEDYYEHIRTGKQEKLFHEVIFQIGNKDDMGCMTAEGQLAKEILMEFAEEFQKRNPQFRVFGVYLHMDEATPHLHIDFVPFMEESKRGLDTRVSMKRALASRGFTGKGKQETEYNQWIESEKEELAKVAERHGVLWEQKGTHREHLSVYDYKKEERIKEVKELEDEKQQLHEEVGHMQERREKLQPVMDRVDKELHKIGKVEAILPEAGALERAVTYREKKVKPVFWKLKNSVAALSAKVVELTDEVAKWKMKYFEVKKDYDELEAAAQDMVKFCDQLTDERENLLDELEQYDRVENLIGEDMMSQLIQESIKREREQKQVKQKKKNRGMEL